MSMLLDQSLQAGHLQMEERSQAFARVIFSAVFGLYFVSLPWLSNGQINDSWTILVTVAAISLGYGVAQLWLLGPDRRFSPKRQLLTICIDIGLLSTCMYLAGDWSAIGYPLFLWIVVGNGIRFGLGYMWFAMIIGVIGFLSALLYNEYWIANRLAGIGLILGIVVLPLFFSIVLRRLHEVNHQLEIELSRTSYAANHDSLTGLANRLRFNRRLNNEIQRAKRTGLEFAILFMDLDRFKAINDSYGHDTGDNLLIHVAERIKRVVRETDLAARLGGDEFGFITIIGKSGNDVAGLVSRLKKTISAPYELGGFTLNIGTSIGIALFPADGDDCESLLQAADQRMYEKKGGQPSQTAA